MKVLLLFSGHDSLSEVFHEGFSESGNEVHVLNYLDFLPRQFHRLDSLSSLTPGIIRNNIRKQYLYHIQQKYLEKIQQDKPDLIYIYNDQMFTGHTAELVKNIGCKIGVYLADSAFFLVRREHIMRLLQKADHIFAPDSFWLHQLNLLGMINTTFLIPGYSKNIVRKIVPTSEDLKSYRSDLVYIGSPYFDVWGFKRALFLSKFADFDIKIYGPKKWQRWFEEFPSLQAKFTLLENRLSFEKVNLLMNCSRIYPVDANPGSINGLHIRIFDAIGAGILPVVEYKKDIQKVFYDNNMPVFENYNRIKETVSIYLDDEQKRISLVKELKSFVDSNYSPLKAAQLILSKIFG